MKKRKNIKKIPAETKIEAGLPQNIVPVGEQVFEDKNIYIQQDVYKKIHKFAENKTENEHGGILVGHVVNELGKENTIIEGFIEAKYNEATPTTLTFTHKTWEYFHSEIDKRFNGEKIVGWIHTHPNFGVFLSENDRFIQQNFFTDKNQVAYVVDPIQNDEGFFFWVDEKLERCPGFYIFDKNGVKIKPIASNDDNEIIVVNKSSKVTVFLFIVTIAMILVNIFNSLNYSEKIKTLQQENSEIKEQIFYMTNTINSQEMMIQQIRDENEKQQDEQIRQQEREQNQQEEEQTKEENQELEDGQGGQI